MKTESRETKGSREMERDDQGTGESSREVRYMSLLRSHIHSLIRSFIDTYIYLDLLLLLFFLLHVASVSGDKSTRIVLVTFSSYRGLPLY